MVVRVSRAAMKLRFQQICRSTAVVAYHHPLMPNLDGWRSQGICPDEANALLNERTICWCSVQNPQLPILVLHHGQHTGLSNSSDRSVINLAWRREHQLRNAQASWALTDVEIML